MSKLSQVSHVFFVSVMYYYFLKKKSHFLSSSVALRADAALVKLCFGAVVAFASSALWNTSLFPRLSHCFFLTRNEHEGIPANLIHHLDVCVEIPQQGIIRSLNVHVSGALLIWEYTRQQVIKQKQQK